MGYAEIETEDGTVDLAAAVRTRHAVIAGGNPYVLIVLDPEHGASVSWFGLDAPQAEIGQALVEIGQGLAEPREAFAPKRTR